VADSRSPDAIQREIEATRSELADTIDAIADRVSPKKAASRSAQAVRAKASAALGHAEKAVSDVTSRVGGDEEAEQEQPIGVDQMRRENTGRVTPTDGATALRAVDDTELNGRPASVLDATPEQAARSQPVAQLHQRALRTDRVLVTVGIAAAAVGALVLVRSRRR
jgi:ElaB/YqjD/DUF883 family membrane-anchored ribosome-binding protein